MERCDFSSISTCLKNQISESNQMNQPDFLYELFEDFMNDPINEDFSMDNGLICRWITGQAKISPKITSYYAKPSNQKKLATTIQRNLLPLMADCNMVIQDIYTLFIQDDTISDTKKQELVSLYKPSDSRLLFLAKVLSFGMERQFIKRDTRNQKLIAGGVLSPIVLDYIMDSEVPKPCRHFLGREEELDELHTLFEENRHIFLYGIAGIGKSELAKAYAKQYRKQYTNILYMEYTGNLYQDIVDMDFIDDPPEISEQERFQRHNRFLRSLKSDTLLIIDNFNVTSTQDSCLSVVLKYRCRVLFTTRSQLSEYCSFQLKELKDIPTLFQLTSVFYSEAEENRAIVEKIIETVHYHTFAVELAAKLLENGILTPEQLLIKLQEEKASLHNEDKIKVMKDGQSKKATYYNHIHTLFSLYSLSRKQQDIMCNMCFMPSSGISARIFSKWLELPTLNDVNDLIETGFVQSSLRHTISLHPMIQEIAVSETAPSVTSCHTLLDSLQKICLMHGIEVSYYKKLFQTVENIMLFIEKLDELVVFAINQQLKQMKMDMKNLETQIRQKQPELDGKIAKLQAKIERNLEYRKRAYEQFMDEVLSKEEYLELKQMYETENQKYQKELSELNHEEQRQRAAVNETKIWLEHFNRRRITVKQLTREALVELVDKIYVYPEQKIDIYFKFASVESSPDRILEKDGVI